MRIFISVLMLLVPVPFAAAQDCPELQPTLRDYHIPRIRRILHQRQRHNP